MTTSQPVSDQEPDPVSTPTLDVLDPVASQPGAFVGAGKPLPDIPDGIEMPPAHIPEPEPARPIESWRSVTAGTAAWPVKNLDGTFSAGGLVKETLCKAPDGLPRCVHANQDGRCSGPPTEEMRRSMTSCVAYRDRYVR